jgi:integrase
MGRPKKIEKKPNKDGFYRVDRTIGKDINGKPIVKIFRSKVSYEKALEKAERYESQKDTCNITFGDWATKWLWDYKQPTVKANTFEITYRVIVENHLIPYFKHFKLKDITSAMIQQFFNSNQHLSKSTLNKMKITLSQIYNTAIANRMVDFSPLMAVKIKSTHTKEVKQTFTYEEIEEIKKQAITHRNGLPVSILVYMGLRASELCGLKYEDIDLDNHTMSIKRACTSLKGMAVIGETKNKTSNRTIPIPEELMEMLKANYSKGFIVSRKNKKPMPPDEFTKKIYHKFFEETGIRYLSPHQMRHTCGTLLYEKCHDVFAVQCFLGHSNAIVTSSIYVHANPEDLRKQLFK